MSDKRLGKGLDFLIKRTSNPQSGEAAPAKEAPQKVPVSSITPNRYQPREHFEIEALNDLIESIRMHGVIQPIAVRKTPSGYELISGERRWRACQELGLEDVPAIVHEVDDQQMLELALIENIQREDLDPIEKATAYRQLIDEFDLTQGDAAKRLSQKRSTVANYLRLLELSGDVQGLVAAGGLSMGHARAVLGISGTREQTRLAHRIVNEGLSVRQVEAIVREAKPVSRDAAPKADLSPHFEELASRMREALGTRVSVKGTSKKGRVVIEYFDADALERILACVEAGADAGRARTEPLD